MSKKKAAESPVKDVRLCTDVDGYEAIYVNGKLKFAQHTFYMWEVARLAGRRPVTLRHHDVRIIDDSEHWPKRFSDLKLVN